MSNSSAISVSAKMHDATLEPQDNTIFTLSFKNKAVDERAQNIAARLKLTRTDSGSLNTDEIILAQKEVVLLKLDPGQVDQRTISVETKGDNGGEVIGDYNIEVLLDYQLTRADWSCASVPFTVEPD
ncbi:hypothetical protein [Labrenzia sp. VG12]|uniref:hypothetical protein n=1 Tax=Labrenzia sp. VG12 TaxID=2021862 RepID=UPI0012FE2DDC|nr:hypothetical protein [Labrenzia sp. VG12]